MGWGWSVGWQLWVTDRTVSGRNRLPVPRLQRGRATHVSAAM